MTFLSEMPGTRELPCPQCPGKMRLRSSRFGPFYGCENFPDCDATHGAHPDGAPLGAPADKATKLARIEAHRLFDQLWKDAPALYDLAGAPAKLRERQERNIQRRARSRAYQWLACELGIAFEDCHIGAFDRELCERAALICRPVLPRDIRDWAKARGL